MHTGREIHKGISIHTGIVEIHKWPCKRCNEAFHETPHTCRRCCSRRSSLSFPSLSSPLSLTPVLTPVLTPSISPSNLTPRTPSPRTHSPFELFMKVATSPRNAESSTMGDYSAFGDWQCPSCKYMVYAVKTSCSTCGIARP
jgi:hypothetical protein